MMQREYGGPVVELRCPLQGLIVAIDTNATFVVPKADERLTVDGIVDDVMIGAVERYSAATVRPWEHPITNERERVVLWVRCFQ